MEDKVFITKFALTRGIVEIAAKDVTRFPHDPALLRSGKDGYVYLYHKPEWHDTRDEAVTRAEQMRKQEIASLEKKLKKLKDIAIDEISVGKGHRYLTVVLDLDSGAVVFESDGGGAAAKCV